MAFADPQRSIAQLDVASGMHVADFGAGAGHVAVALAEAVGESGKVYVIDIQRDLLTKARHYAQEHHITILNFVHGDLEAPRGSTLEDGSVDVVVCSNLLFQVEDKPAVLREAYRVLRPAGRLLIVDWRESYGGIGPQPETVFSEETARALAEEVGFRWLQEIDAGDHHYGSIFRK